MALIAAHASGRLPSLAAPVVFTGADADRFLAELPSELSDEAADRLRASVAAADAAMSGQSANSFFE